MIRAKHQGAARQRQHPTIQNALPYAQSNINSNDGVGNESNQIGMYTVACIAAEHTWLVAPVSETISIPVALPGRPAS
jgi:hypothetical protein